jgi:hypothetical protein
MNPFICLIGILVGAGIVALSYNLPDPQVECWHGMYINSTFKCTNR